MAMARYPGARFYGIGGNGNRCRPRSASWHEAVTTSDVEGLISWSRSARAFHLCIAQDGDAGQACDFDEAVNGVSAGNGEVLTIETWDGLLPATGRSPDGSFGPNDRRWSDQQAERIIDMIAWMSLADTLGIPVRWMGNTREAGHAPHRLGVPSAGGSVRIGYGPDQWTAHPGKECPGDQRVLQLRDEIIPAAQKLAPLLATGAVRPLPTGPVDVAAARARYSGAKPGRSSSDWLRLLAAVARSA